MRARPIAIAGFAVAGVAALYCFYRAFAAWRGWPSPHRGWPSPHIELGNLSEGLAALFTVAAVVAALVIAGRDRRDRTAERREGEKTHARLVLLTVQPSSSPPATLTVEARNFGPLPVLDIEFASAAWSEHPTARVEVGYGQYQGISFRSTARRRPVLMPSREFQRNNTTAVDFTVRFKHETDDRPLTEPTARTAAYPMPSYEPIDLSNLVVKIRFTTADGVRWETPTDESGSGEPVRLGSVSRTETPRRRATRRP